jgi:hypothetical protein
VVEHGEVERIDAGDVTQLPARRIAFARPLDLDHIGAEPGQQLRAGRTRLHVGEVEHLDVGECLHVAGSFLKAIGK